MAGIQLTGASGSVAEVGAFAAEGQHVIAKPTDHGALGHYRFQVVTGTLAAAQAASNQYLQFKWTDATRFAVIKKVWSGFQTLTRFTAGTITDFGLDLFMVRSYAAGAAATLTLTGDNQQLRTSMGASLAAVTIATTGGLTAATTLDAHPIGQTIGGHGNQVVPSATLFGSMDTLAVNGHETGGLLYRCSLDAGEHPIVLAQNEGLVIRNRAVWPAAGTGIYSFGMVWCECTAF